jgi:hypothetical protein
MHCNTFGLEGRQPGHAHRPAQTLRHVDGKGLGGARLSQPFISLAEDMRPGTAVDTPASICASLR